jgi:tRNA A-37 threonylcarbamoyl transferase component Bud32
MSLAPRAAARVAIGPGDVVAGRWSITGELARGGSSIVYAGVDLETGRAVAMKVVSSSVARTPELLARLRREARVLSSIRHPGVVELIALVEALDELVVVLEHVRGETLEARVARLGPLAVTEAEAIAAQLAGALAAVHAEGALHRDVKPANVMLAPGGMVRLVDFGAVHVVGDSPITAPGMWVGTPTHVAPELVAGQQPDPRADLYALGLTLYFALTGTLPERTPDGFVRAAPHGHRPSQHATGVPAWLDALVRRATMADPRLRFPTAAALARALEVRGGDAAPGAVVRRRDRLCLGCGGEAQPSRAFCGPCALADAQPILLYVDAARVRSFGEAHVQRVLALGSIESPSAARAVLVGRRPLVAVAASHAARVGAQLEAEGLPVVSRAAREVRAEHLARALGRWGAPLGALALGAGVFGGLASATAASIAVAALAAAAVIGGARGVVDARPVVTRRASIVPPPVRVALARALEGVAAVEARAVVGDVTSLIVELLEAEPGSTLQTELVALLGSVADAAQALGRTERVRARFLALAGASSGASVPDASGYAEVLARADALRGGLIAQLLGALATLGAHAGIEAQGLAEGGRLERARRAVEAELALRREALAEVDAWVAGEAETSAVSPQDGAAPRPAPGSSSAPPPAAAPGSAPA